MMNAHGHGEVVLMSSSSQLFAVVADAYRRAGAIKTGDEIVILESAHEVSLSLRWSHLWTLSVSVHSTVQGASQCCTPYAARVQDQAATHGPGGILLTINSVCLRTMLGTTALIVTVMLTIAGPFIQVKARSGCAHTTCLHALVDRATTSALCCTPVLGSACAKTQHYMPVLQVGVLSASPHCCTS